MSENLTLEPILLDKIEGDSTRNRDFVRLAFLVNWTAALLSRYAYSFFHQNMDHFQENHFHA